MSEVSIRFGVGDGKNRRAATWKCWASRGSGKHDVYLACRELRGALKASLHASGQWHVSFDRTFLEASAVAEEWPTRFLEFWARPGELVPGFTLAYRIITPHAAVNAALNERDARDVTWITPPPRGQVVETVVAITRSEHTAINWPGRRSMGTQLVGRFELDNGDVVWTVARPITVPDFQVSMNRQRFFHGKTKADVRGPGLRGIMFGEEPDGSRVMWEVVEAGEAFDSGN